MLIRLSPYLTRQYFASADELEAVGSQRSEFRVTQLRPGPLNCEIFSLRLGPVVFEFRQLNAPLRICGAKNHQDLVFEFILSPVQGEYLSHGFSLDQNTLYGFDSGRGIDLVLPQNIVMGTLMAPRSVFSDYLTLMERPDLDEKFFARNYIQNPLKFKSVQAYLWELYGLVKTQSSFLTSAKIHQLLLEDYLPLLIDSIPRQGKQQSEPPKLFKKSVLAQNAEAYMLSHLDSPLTLKDLCETFHVGKSALSESFQATFGVSPLTYLKYLRLHAVRKVLQESAPNTKITSLIHQFGFWHAGRFSREYKILFGESPSETLKK